MILYEDNGTTYDASLYDDFIVLEMVDRTIEFKIYPNIISDVNISIDLVVDDKIIASDVAKVKIGYFNEKDYQEFLEDGGEMPVLENIDENIDGSLIDSYYELKEIYDSFILNNNSAIANKNSNLVWTIMNNCFALPLMFTNAENAGDIARLIEETNEKIEEYQDIAQQIIEEINDAYDADNDLMNNFAEDFEYFLTRIDDEFRNAHNDEIQAIQENSDDISQRMMTSLMIAMSTLIYNSFAEEIEDLIIRLDLLKSC